ncbi:hypothetical protein H5410_007046 [Solanum commersonii]|uniref:ACT domain-containing protein ACR n=1 Tax=Solanum commersonii TaxID=4109 RepID=A0A9J6ABY4_SOLCO|nr:hypothetical protein H5410_007046 [Solanum commersonii]
MMLVRDSQDLLEEFKQVMLLVEEMKAKVVVFESSSAGLKLEPFIPSKTTKDHTRKISKTSNDSAQVNSPSDRPGLLSHVSTVHTNLKCNVVNAKDRPKLLFDTIFTLADMQYVVFHGNVDAEGLVVHQELQFSIRFEISLMEYNIRHIDGSPVKPDAEQKRVILCLEAAIERRVSEVYDNYSEDVDLKVDSLTNDSTPVGG